MRVGEETPGLGSSTKGVLQKCPPSTLTPLGDCVFRDNGLRAVGAQRQKVMDGYGGIHLLLIWMRWKCREALAIWGGEEAQCPAPGKRMLKYTYFVPWLSWQEVLPLLWSLWLCGERDFPTRIGEKQFGLVWKQLQFEYFSAKQSSKEKIKKKKKRPPICLTWTLNVHQ